MRRAALWSRDAAGGLSALFAGRRAAFSFNTRVAIRQACDLLGLRPGDEVLAPAYNCGSELDPLRDAGLTVRLFPVDRQAVVDAGAVAAMITARTRAVYLIHYFGFLQPATDAIRALCDERGLFLIEDCALSLMSGAKLADGRAGDVSLFCFYKFFPTLGGGALVVNRDRLPDPAGFPARLPMRMAARHLVRAGIDIVFGAGNRAALMRRLKPGTGAGAGPVAPPPGLPDMPGHYYFDPRLANAGLSALTARQIRSFDVAGAIAARRANYQAYLDAFAGMPDVTPLFAGLAPGVCPLAMPVLVERRDALAAELGARGIAATPWWAGYSRHLDFTGQTGACHLKDHLLSLPVHQYLGAGAVSHIAATLGELIARG